MECNRAEADRALQIALTKFHEKDISGAKRFALRAHKLFPELEGIQQLLGTLHVHIAAAKDNGEKDWYAILGANPSDDQEAIRKCYRKVLLMVHPDKNKWEGAAEAFRLVSEAWDVLQYKERRDAYDQSRQEKRASEHGTKKVSRSRSNTFWTACTHCKFKYEFERLYIDAKLICPRSECKKMFSASETSSPHGAKKSEKKEGASSKRQKWNKFTASGGSSSAFRTPQVPHFVETETASAHASANTHAEPGKRAEHVIREEQPMLFQKNTYCRNGKRTGTFPPDDTGSDGNPIKKRHTDGNAIAKDVSCENGGSVSLADKPVSKLDHVSRQKANEKLTEIAKAAIWKKLTDLKDIAAGTSKKSREVGSSRVEGRKLKGSSSWITEKVNANVPFLPTDASITGMEVPDQDFHNFDNRGEWKFEKGQVWALYDDPHGLPRLYAAVESVISRKPFKAMVRWLHSRSNNEFGPMEWIASGFQKTSGVFLRGKRELIDVELCFSHIVSCKRSSRGMVEIYPKKGDVWAVYRNWSPEWDASVRLSPEVFNKFDLVEVLQDYTEEMGVAVAPLIKVPGFKSVLKRNSDPASHMTFPKHEIFRLSHHVPFCLLTEHSYPSAPRGCIEIDLAAVPSEFAVVIPEEPSANKPREQS